ncbi:LLM class flavin-dependent oxidoreductase [Actinomadura flavalba]|uniref:LLM class flavin-dependent oxidoreductase n=1 Tax=Actinomadura flavalba TaxID=1120938 RepID=UPI00036F883B|nr:LLM class flavin-dependent oxidoreductase [Actinomadura flavalba]
MPQTPSKVLFGYGPGPFIPVARAARLLEEAAQADREGLDLITVTDHPYNGVNLEAYGTLGVILGRTTNLTVVATVTNLPVRPAPLLARTVTTLSALSGGRIVLGVGAGSLWDGIVGFGVDRLTPGQAVRQLEEGIVLIKALAGGGTEPVTFDGEFYRVDALDPAPVPVPPIWTGSVGPRSLAVTGRHADGWSAPHASDWDSKLYREARPLIDEAAVAAGRAPSDVGDYFNVRGRITAEPLPSTHDENGTFLGGSPAQWIDHLTTGALDHGASGFVFFDPDDPRSDRTLGRWTQEVVPAVREAIAKD